jgi:hypothetical protein
MGPCVGHRWGRLGRATDDVCVIVQLIVLVTQRTARRPSMVRRIPPRKAALLYPG